MNIQTLKAKLIKANAKMKTAIKLGVRKLARKIIMIILEIEAMIEKLNTNKVDQAIALYKQMCELQDNANKNGWGNSFDTYRQLKDEHQDLFRSLDKTERRQYLSATANF